MLLLSLAKDGRGNEMRVIGSNEVRIAQRLAMGVERGTITDFSSLSLGWGSPDFEII